VKTKKFGSDVVLGAAAAAAVSMSALAGDAVQWRVADGGNGHWYRAVDAATGDSAIVLAASLGGNLATIANAGENAIVKQVFLATGKQYAWIGLLQASGQATPGAGWYWVTGEPLKYLNWTDHNGAFPTSAPDDSPCAISPWGVENDQANQGVMDPTGRWDDLENGMPTCGSPVWNNAAIVEWSADCNSDGIVDYGQILAGTLDDANANGVPDRCECATNPGLPSCCLGDIVNDRTVNGADLGTLLAYWGPVTSGAFSIASDLNNDGDIDGSDLGILLAYWGACPTANVPAWATLIEAMPDPAVVTDPALRTAIAATGLAWRVRDTGTGIEMLLVPPGIFQMGCTAAPIGQVCHGNYVPVHAVTLTSAYYLARYEVTQAQWVAKMGSNPSYFKELSNSPSRPVEQVSWSMVKSFASGNGLRLPTEAEWEFACKAGTTTAFYNDSNEPSVLEAIGWVPANALDQTHPVGGLAPNGLGFFDMVGNVWEFVSDYWGTYSANPQTNPVGPESGSQAIGRGGSYDTNNPPVYSATRSPTITTADTSRILGFRVARNP
jgi:formylglycine-generating enzyme required for sulfatase activity